METKAEYGARKRVRVDGGTRKGGPEIKTGATFGLSKTTYGPGGPE